MHTVGNLALGFAFALLFYPLLPDFPGLRAAVMRRNLGFLDTLYVMLFVLPPRWLRRLLALLMMWGFLMTALTASIDAGGLNWLPAGRFIQGLVALLSCLSMAVITLFIGLTPRSAMDSMPNVVRAISPWAAYALPVAVMFFALFVLNPALAHPLPTPWIFRVPLLAAFALSLPIGAVLFVRWITPTRSAAPKAI